MTPYALTLDLGKVVGARLRELRHDAELTQDDIARRMGSYRPIIGRIENGLHDLDVATVARYARALELDLATVLVCLEPDWPAADERVASFKKRARAQRRVVAHQFRPYARRVRGAAA